MKNDVRLIDKLGRQWMVVNSIDRVMKLRLAFEMLDILNSTCRQIINDINFIAAFDIRVG